MQNKQKHSRSIKFPFKIKRRINNTEDTRKTLEILRKKRYSLVPDFS